MVWNEAAGGDGGPEWVTGEPVTYRNFMNEMEEDCHGPKAHARLWRADTAGNPRNPFVVERES